MDTSKNIWTIKGATLSDKNARKEYGLTQEEIIKALKKEKLQYRVNYIHGNPYYKLIRKEVELLVTESYGENFLEKMAVTTRLNQVTSELRKLKRQIKTLSTEKNDLEKKLTDLETKE